MTVKQKILLTSALVFFVLINTRYYWESKIGVAALLAFLLLILGFFALCLAIALQFFYLINEKFRNKKRLYLTGLLVVIIILVALFPSGLINIEDFERDSLLIAEREGAANCTTSLNLKADNSFTERNVCFGVSETSGTYKIKGDTIFFTNTPGRNSGNTYSHAVIKPRTGNNKDYLGELVRYENHADTVGTALWITKNDLVK